MPELDDRDGLRRPPGEGTLYVSFPSLNNPAARFHTVELLELVEPRVVDRWRGTQAERRPRDYERFKHDVTERLIARLERRWPGIGKTIAFSELATTTDVRDLSAQRPGFLRHGLAATPQRLRSSVAGCRTLVKGLFVAGQDAWGSGVVGALAGGLMAANAVLTPRQLGAMWRTIRSGVTPRSPTTAWQGYLRVAAVEALTRRPGGSASNPWIPARCRSRSPPGST